MPVQGRIQRRLRTLDPVMFVLKGLERPKPWQIYLQRSEAQGWQQLNVLVPKAKLNQLVGVSEIQRFECWLASELVELLPTLPRPRPNDMLCRSMKDLLQLRYLTNIPFHGQPNTGLGHTVQEQKTFTP